MRLALELGWQSLRRRPGRYLAPIIVATAATLVVLCATGFYLGMLDASVAWTDSLPGELVVVATEGNPGLMQAYSDIPDDTVDAVRAAVPDAEVHPLVGQRAWLWRDGRDAWAYVVGIHPKDTFGLPLRVIAGTARPRIGEIVVDEVVARDLGVGLGDAVKVRAATLHVSGIASGSNNVIGSIAFVSRATMALAGVPRPTHLFVAVAPGADVAAVAARLAAVPDVRALDRAAFDDSTRSLPQHVFRPVIGVIDGVAIAMAALVIAVVLRAASVERRPEFGLVRALGVPRRVIAASVVWATALATAGGAAAGVALAAALAALLRHVEPRFVWSMPWWLVAVVGLAVVAVGLFAALQPVRVIGRTDPALVLRV